MDRMSMVKDLVQSAIDKVIVSNGLCNSMPSTVIGPTGETRMALQEDAVYTYFYIPHLELVRHENNPTGKLSSLIEDGVKAAIEAAILEFKPDKVIVAAMGGKLFGVELRPVECVDVRGMIYSYPIYQE